MLDSGPEIVLLIHEPTIARSYLAGPSQEPFDGSALRSAHALVPYPGDELFVAGLLYQPDDWDVILGMDFIGMFHITIYGNRIILSN